MIQLSGGIIRLKEAWNMKTIPMNINIPSTANLTEADLKMFLASKLYETTQLSLGQAAEVAGVSKRTFTEMLGRYGVALFSQSSEDMAGDIANA
jgi:predicted HTH domain antitoxin